MYYKQITNHKNKFKLKDNKQFKNSKLSSFKLQNSNFKVYRIQ